MAPPGQGRHGQGSPGKRGRGRLAEAQNAGYASGSQYPRWQGRPLGRLRVKWGRQREGWAGGELGERRGLAGRHQLPTLDRVSRPQGQGGGMNGGVAPLVVGGDEGGARLTAPVSSGCCEAHPPLEAMQKVVSSMGVERPDQAPPSPRLLRTDECRRTSDSPSGRSGRGCPCPPVPSWETNSPQIYETSKWTWAGPPIHHLLIQVSSSELTLVLDPIHHQNPDQVPLDFQILSMFDLNGLT